MYKMSIIGEIGGWEVYPEDVVSEIQRQNDDLEVRLDSIGGSVIGGIAIANAFRDHIEKGFKVDFIVDGVVASIATYIAMQGTSLTVRDNTPFMYHNAWLPVAGDFIQLRKGADISEGLSSIMANDYSKKSGLPLETVKQEMNEETYYYGDEIVARGFADSIKESDTELNKSEAFALTMETLKACNNHIKENEKIDYESVAKLIPKKDEVDPKAKQLEDEKEEKRLADSQAKQNRNRKLSILKRKV